MRATAMELAGKSEPSGKAYTVHFSHWLQEHHFHDIDKADRAKLMQMIEKLPELEDWRGTLAATTRQRLNHPSALWRAWKCKNRGGRWRLQQADVTEIRDDSTDTTVRAHETESEDALSAGSLLVKANKAAGLANDCRRFAGELDGIILRAVKEACRAWAETADLFEARFSERQDA